MRRLWQRFQAWRRKRRTARTLKALYGKRQWPGSHFCSDCPDHEGCANGVPCYEAHLIQRRWEAQQKGAR